MARIPRITQLQFGVSGPSAYFGQFGSKAAGFPVTTKDAASIQALAAFIQNGWKDAINNANKAPYLEDLNGITALIFQQLCEIFQDGVPIYDGGTTYFVGSIINDGNGNLYKSTVDNNLNNSPTNPAFWTQLITTSQVASGIVMEFAGSGPPPSGWLLCDGSSYPTATYPALFAAIGYSWGGSGPNFNVPDLRGRATIGAGAGPGLTFRAFAALVGEESHTLVIGELPGHSHGVTDPGHIHKEQFSFNDGVSPSLTAAATGGEVPIDSHSGIDSLEKTVSATTGITIANAGGGGSHNNMQPSAALWKIIKI